MEELNKKDQLIKISQGAEAIIYLNDNQKLIIKHRIKKSYRHSKIDLKLRKQRTKTEYKIIRFLKDNSLYVPDVYDFDLNNFKITMEYIEGEKLSNLKLNEYCIREFAKQLAKMHKLGIAHGDPTTSNIIITNINSKNISSENIISDNNSEKNSKINPSEMKSQKLFIIDFGLSFYTRKVEDFAVDLHLFRQALESRHFDQYEEFFKIFMDEYFKENNSKEIMNRFNVVEKRGRYKAKKIKNNSCK